MRLFAKIFKDEFPAVADFLERLRYVDDMAKSAISQYKRGGYEDYRRRRY